MADPFQDTPPTLDEDTDPAADFLAREQEQMAGLEDGDDFQFTSADNNGADQEQDMFGSEPPAAAAEPFIQSNDLLDEFGGGEPGEPAESMGMPQLNGGSNRASPYGGMGSGFGAMRIEPEKIRIWREEHQARLQEKDEKEEEQIEEMKKAAKKELEDWYKHRDEQFDKTKATNRAAEEAYLKDIEDRAPGSEWERIARLCDFNPKNSKNMRDVTRFRSILLQLKQSGLMKNE